jgi:HSP20 family protein
MQHSTQTHGSASETRGSGRSIEKSRSPQSDLSGYRDYGLSRLGWGKSMRSLTDEVDRLFNEFLDFAGHGRGWLRPSSRYGVATQGLRELNDVIWSPEIEVFERAGQLVVRADLPGLKKDDVKVELNDDNLIIRGERRQEHEENEEGFYQSERSYGSFYRVIPLPDGISDKDVKANFNDGVLDITMPAPERTEHRRRIEVHHGAAEEWPLNKSAKSGK